MLPKKLILFYYFFYSFPHPPSFYSKLEVVIHYVQILYPKLHKHWNVLWIVAAIITVFAVVLGTSCLYNYFFSYTERSDGAQVKPACSAAHRYSWGNSGLQHDQ